MRLFDSAVKIVATQILISFFDQLELLIEIPNSVARQRAYRRMCNTISLLVKLKHIFVGKSISFHWYNLQATVIIKKN